MKPSTILHSNRATIRGVVGSRPAWNPRVFCSVFHDQDTDGSGLDILINPTPEKTLMDLVAVQRDFQRLLDVWVDALIPKSLTDSLHSRVLSVEVSA
ncbi:putative nucleotidyltransferase [Undibacterium sp. GrIS 1.8]